MARAALAVAQAMDDMESFWKTVARTEQRMSDVYTRMVALLDKDGDMIAVTERILSRPRDPMRLSAPPREPLHTEGPHR